MLESPNKSPPAESAAAVIRVDARRIVAIWEKVLRRSDVQETDDFFEIGGDWFGALQARDAMVSSTSSRWPVSLMYQFRTPLALAEALHSPQPSGIESLSLVREGMEEPPIFLVHAIAGWGAELVPFARRLELGRSVYVIEARGLDGAEPPHEDFRHAAREYVEKLRLRQPHGPYFLAGYSAGGLIAFEMARLLTAAGQSVAFLCLIDTFFHFRHWSLRSRIWRYGFMARNRFASLAGTGWRGWASWLIGRILRLLPGRGAPHPAVGMIDPRWPVATQRVRLAQYRAMERYHPSGAYGAPVHFLLARDGTSYLRAAEPRREWRRYIENLRIHVLAAEHTTLTNEHAQVLADAFTRAFGEARAAEERR